MHHFFSKLILSLLLISNQVLAYTQAASDYTIIENKAKTPILTPSLAAAKVLKIKLKNGLEAYIVSDPNVDKSSAAMTVKVGSWDEPKDYPGLAHFLEHMLFLGTKKFPKESEYSRYITEHGGDTNAFTSNDYTSFVFAIDNSAFEEALDRFSNFFKEPLFNPSGVARELHAIDQEYAKNRENDDIRQLFVDKANADKEHPFHAFNMGNSLTLSKVSQETLKEFYHTHYSANLMRLIVISPLSIDKLRDLVVEDFKDVPDNNRAPLNLDLPLFTKDIEGKIIYIEPIKNIRTLTLSWDLPPKFSHMKDSKPDTILCYVLGHEGKESLLAELKRERLAERLSCGNYQLGPNNNEFYLEITLTDLGVKQVYKVIERVFQTIVNFKNKGVPRYLFDEVQKVALMRYQYKPREDAFQNVMKQASWLAQENMETYPEQTLLIKKFDPKAVLDLLDYLTPQNSLIDLAVPSKLTHITPDKLESWLGIEYGIKPIPQHIIDSWKNAQPNPNIDLPAPNPYIPSDLSLLNAILAEKNNERIIPKPEILINNDKSKIYFAPDTKFLTPQIGWIFEFKTPHIQNGDPTKVVLGDLFVKMLQEVLSASSYPATLAGLNYDINLSENGIVIEVEGYNDKAPVLLKEILKQIKDLSFTQERFKVFKDSLAREYQNFSLNPPIMQASEMLKSIIYKEFSTSKQKAIAIRKITFDKFTEFANVIFNQIFIQGMLYGNMTEELAKKLSEDLVDSFAQSRPYPISEQPQVEIIVLPEKKGPFYVEQKISVEGNAALLGIQCLPFSFKNRAAQQILMQAIEEPFFTELRTKQQTGYLVYSTGEELEKHLFNFFAVQSNTHASRDLLARFELFIESYLQELDVELPEERFNKIREALVVNLKTAVRNIKAMAELLNKIAFKYDGDFEWIDRRIAGFNEMKYGEFLNLAQQFLGKQNKRRFAILLKGILPEEKVFQFSPLASFLQLRKLSHFQQKNTEDQRD